MFNIPVSVCTKPCTEGRDGKTSGNPINSFDIGRTEDDSSRCVEVLHQVELSENVHSLPVERTGVDYMNRFHIDISLFNLED